MNFSLRQLRAFLMVAELQSFTRAAERVHLSQAALSLMIKELEDQIGFKVFDRTTRAVTINAAGRKIQPAIQKALIEIEEAIREAANISKYQDNLVRLAATSIVSTNLLPKVVSRMKQKYPLIQIELHDVDRQFIDPLVSAGEVDIGLGLNFNLNGNFKNIGIGTCGLILVGNSGNGGQEPHPSATLMSVHGKDIYALPANNSIQMTIDALLENIEADVHIKSRFSNINTILAMIEANGGFALLPSFAKNACNKFDLTVQEIVDIDYRFEFNAILRSDTAMRDALQCFLQVFKECIEDNLD